MGRASSVRRSPRKASAAAMDTSGGEDLMEADASAFGDASIAAEQENETEDPVPEHDVNQQEE